MRLTDMIDKRRLIRILAVLGLSSNSNYGFCTTNATD